MAKGWIENYVERGNAIAKEFTPDAVKKFPPRDDIGYKFYGLIMYPMFESVVLGYILEDGTKLAVAGDFYITTRDPFSIAQDACIKLKIPFPEVRDRVLKIGLGTRSMFPY